MNLDIIYTEIQNTEGTLIQYIRSETPWSNIGIDLCQISDRTSLLLVTNLIIKLLYKLNNKDFTKDFT